MRIERFKGGTDKPELIEAIDAPDPPTLSKRERLEALLAEKGLSVDDVRDLLVVKDARS